MLRSCYAGLFAAVLYLSIQADARSQTADLAPKQRTVVLISLDGFPAYALEDPKLPVPTLRALMQHGSTARRMTVVNPSVTWPNHTTLVTGVHPIAHGLLYNASAVRTGTWPPIKLDPTVDKEHMEHAVTLYDLARQQGLTTAQIDWVAINNAPTITWAFPEIASPEGPLEREMVEHGIVAREAIENFTHANILWRDEIWAQAATYLLSEHKPNLLLLHFLTLDSVQHRYGPKTLASETAMAFLDRSVAQVLQAIHASGRMDRTTVFIISDHGFKPYQKQIRPAIALAGAGLSDGAYVVPEGGSAMIYLDEKRAAQLRPRVMETLKKIDGIERIDGPEQFASLGIPRPDQDRQAPDLILFAKSGYAFSNGRPGETDVIENLTSQAGGHGYLATDPDMDAIFIAAGYGIRSGVKLDRITNIDVAPTIGHLLGLKLEHAEGHALTQILK